MITFELLHPDMDYEYLGYLPSFLSAADPRPAKEQFDQNYRHGGGWEHFEGFKLLPNNAMKYPDDPPLRPLAQAKLRDELIIFYDGQWVAIIQPDRSFEICRMD